LLGAAPTKAAAQNSFLPLAAAALLMAGTFGLVLAFGSWGTGAAATGGEIVRRNLSLGNLLGRCSAAGEFSPSPFIMSY